MMIMKTLVEKRVVNKILTNTARADSEISLYQNGPKAKFSVSCGCSKRKLDLSLQDQKDKRWKMDPTVKAQCGIVLDALIKHQYGFVFRSPVDPVALGIPDYFSIISHPMDLGTVKSKLSRNTYFNAEEFAADVKLTFSNAMLYNPPNNHVHYMAKELESIFTTRYKLLETKWKQQGTISSGYQILSGDKQKLKNDIMGLLNRKMTVTLQSRLRKLGVQCFEKERIYLDIDALDDEALRKLKNVLIGSLDACSVADQEERESTCPRRGLLAPVTMPKSGTSAKDDDEGVKKALRLAKLTKRYAEIVSKSMSDKADPENLQQEQERLKQLNKMDESEKNHQKEREAFRTAMEMMQKTVEFEDNLQILKELEILSGCSLSDYLYGSDSEMALRDLKTGKVLNPLQHLGLRIKKEFKADDDEETFLSTEREEGEILE